MLKIFSCDDEGDERRNGDSGYWRRNLHMFLKDLVTTVEA
jgi:hypothetical protein